MTVVGFIQKAKSVILFKIKKIALSLKAYPRIVPYFAKGDKKIIHVSAFNYGNAGDTLLPVVLQDLFNQCIGVKKWSNIHTSKIVDNRVLKQINAHDAIVVGGGGLFLKDTNQNNLSGWQWSCGIDELGKIEKPLIVFALGYNRFRGQEEFEPIFFEHVNLLVEKASFLGLRNYGSIRRVKGYLKDSNLKSKLVYQPCMTTIISKIYPNLTNYLDKKDFIAFNCAFDRQKLRVQSDDKLISIAKVAKKMAQITKIKYYSHMKTDLNILPYFDQYNVPYEVVEFSNIEEMVKEYASARLVIGMRGHAQMVPFGCLTPILSIVSHDKMQWFLDDIKHSDWGVEILSEDFEKSLLEKATDYYMNYQEHIEDVKKAQNILYDITLENMAKIEEIVN